MTVFTTFSVMTSVCRNKRTLLTVQCRDSHHHYSPPPDAKEEDVIKKLPETSSELVSIVPHEMTKKIFPYNTLVERKMT